MVGKILIDVLNNHPPARHMEQLLKNEKDYSYIEIGEGESIVALHGLMGELSNFEHVIQYFGANGYKVIMPILPIYTMPLGNTTVKGLADFVHEFISYKALDKVILLGNSLGGHIGLSYSKLHPEKVSRLILTGSSGLFESSMGSGYTRRKDYNVIREKVEEVFYDPAVATKELVDEAYETLNDRRKLARVLLMAKSAIRHNMAKCLPEITTPTCLIWGEDDIVTPPHVAVQFDELLPNSDLFWIEKCGHAAMLEHPQKFNAIMENWLSSRAS